MNNTEKKSQKITEKKEVTLNSQTIQETMLIPLWGRAKYSKLYPQLLKDPIAEEIIKKIDYDFSTFDDKLGEYGGIGYLVRARRFDDAINVFIKTHPLATIINMGSGLDTTFSRVDNGKINWVNLDLPDALTFRNEVIPGSKRSVDVACSAFDYSWFDEISYDKDTGIFIIAGGLFMYFSAEEVRDLFITLANRFPQGEILFDCMSKLGVKIINKRLKGTGVPTMNFGIGSPHRVIPKWSPKLKVIFSCGFYEGIPRDPNWKKATVKMMNMNDKFKTGKFVQLKFV
jgi:O-methyltransferase involved in polyketide biosynthesis